MTPDEEEFEILNRLMFTKEQREFPEKLENAKADLGIIDIENASIDEMLKLSERMFGKK